MTLDELNKLPFRFNAHMNMADEHTTSYFCTDERYDIGFCDHVPYKDGWPHGRSYRHWMVNGKVYKSTKKLLEAIKEL